VAAITPLRLLALILALSGAIALSTPAAASAATPCWNRILDDWWDNERIDGTYSLKCYREAEENMSQDLRDYSDLPGEIARARQRALRAGSEEGEDARVVQSAGPVDERTDSDGVAGDSGGGSDDGGPIHSALEELGPSSADSPPIPLLVLAGLALLLVAAGAAGLLSRRLQARRARVTPPIDPEP
jgi:hypothetical protein